MNKKKKFIVVDSIDGLEFRIGTPIYHKDLLTKDDIRWNSRCLGGGEWEADIENKTIKLFGASDDFDKPSSKSLRDSIATYDRFELTYLIQLVYGVDIYTDDFKFDISYYGYDKLI